MKLDYGWSDFNPFASNEDDDEDEKKSKHKPKKKSKKHHKSKGSKDLLEFLERNGKSRKVEALDDREKYKTEKQKFVSYLLHMMRKMNRYSGKASAGDYVSGAKGRICSSRSSLIFQTSQLWRGQKEMVSIRSILFKYRFLTFLYSDLARNIDTIVDWEMKQLGRRLTEDVDRCRILKRLTSSVGRFTKSLLFGGEDSMVPMVEMDYFLYPGKSKRKRLIIETIVEHLNVIRDNQRLTNGKYLDDYVVINDLMKLAYVAVTESADLRNTFPLVADVTFWNRDKIKMMLGKLGKDIITYRRKNDNRHSVLYDIFLYSCPEILSTFPEMETSASIQVGVRALYYLGFMANDPKIWRLIRRII